jgi:hypothetical protein
LIARGAEAACPPIQLIGSLALLSMRIVMRLVSRLAPLAAALALFAACSEDDPTPPQQTPTLSVSSATTTATVARGSSATYPITIVRGGGYTGQVTLAAVGLPADVQASFAPQTLPNGTTTSTLTLTAGASAPAAATTFTVTAAGAGVTPATSSQLSITVTAPPPSIALAAGTPARTVVQGSTTTIPVNITRTNFTGDVAVAVTGLPAGVTATFNPASPLGAGVNATTLTLTAAANAAVTTTPANITITASGTGVTAQTATVALSVGAPTPGITLAASPATASVVAGQGLATPITVTLTRLAAFDGAVNLTVEGAPAGVTATLTPASLTGTALTSSLAITTTVAAVPGTHILTIRGTSGTTTTIATVSLTITAPPSIGVTLGTPALSVASGGTATSTITLVRGGGVTGDVTLTTTGTLPVGMTIAFTPANGVVPGANTTASIAVNTTAATPAGSYTLTVTGTGATGVVGTAPLTVTVTAPQAITVAAPAATAVAGSTTSTSAITITRLGGFDGAVTFALSGLPAGITGTFTPVTTGGNTSTLTFNVPAGTAAGTYTGTITASGAGITNVTAPITLTVTAAGGGGGNVVARFCDPATLPLWVAVRQGTTGAWTQVTASANNTYNINVTGALGSIAYAQPDGSGGVSVHVNNGTATELAAFAAQECATNPATKTVTATVTGLSAGQKADVSLGGGKGTVTFPNTTVQIIGARDGSADLIAVRYTSDLTGLVTTPDRVVIRRGINPAANSTITPVIDFNGTESAAVGTATYTIANAGTPAFMFVANTFNSANGAGATFGYGSLVGTGTTRTVYGLPSTHTQAGDQHFVLVTVADDENGQSIRLVGQTNRELATRTITLGATLSAPAVTVAGTTPYVRLRATGPIQADYGEAVTATFTQASNPSRSWVIMASRAFIGATAATYALEIPDLTGVGGFQNTWGLRTGVATGWNVTAYSGLLAFAGGFTEGAAFRGAARAGEITP